MNNYDIIGFICSAPYSRFPGAVIIDDSGVRDPVPQAGVLHRVDRLLGVDVQMDTEHDTTERSSQTKRKVSVLHTSGGAGGGRRKEGG